MSAIQENKQRGKALFTDPIINILFPKFSVLKYQSHAYQYKQIRPSSNTFDFSNSPQDCTFDMIYTITDILLNSDS